MNKMRNKYKKETALCCQLFYGSMPDNKTASVAAAGSVIVVSNDYLGAATNTNPYGSMCLMCLLELL